VNLWIYAARMDVPAARTNLVNLAGIQPPPVDPQVFYERQRAYDALGQAAYNAGAAIGGATNDSGSYRAPQHTFGIMTPTGMESWNVRTGEKVIQYNNPDGSYDTYSFGGRK
jgi:hypothetical protein